eukprot:6491862-Amphidinium_carterae.1
MAHFRMAENPELLESQLDNCGAVAFGRTVPSQQHILKYLQHCNCNRNGGNSGQYIWSSLGSWWQPQVLSMSESVLTLQQLIRQCEEIVWERENPLVQ